MSRGRTVKKLAIANRGEVAVRIIRACQELGIQTLLLHSEVDQNSDAFRLADECHDLGEPEVSKSYLNIDLIVAAALAHDADAIHPGFGFLSENADFVEACAQKRLLFVGPDAESVRTFGDKIRAKILVERAGVPVIPGYTGDRQEPEFLLKELDRIGYPAIVKVAGGGGGRGLKVIRAPDEAREKIESAQREGLSSFGSSRVFLERYLDHARHIEVQIFGSADGTIYHLGERDCSVQRRHQKVIEESPALELDFDLRQEILSAAVKIGEESRYRGAGTVEFLVQDGEFYFMEMNTRLQVEHPVTEMVMGVDLVKSQILTAQGQVMLWDQAQFTPRGHSIECRIYAEDPHRGGVPVTGALGTCLWPTGPGRRFDVGFSRGDRITSFYDSMIAKVIVWDETRARALRKMREVLSETVIFGLQTNIPFLKAILSHKDFVAGKHDTEFLNRCFPTALEGQPRPAWHKELAGLVAGRVLAGPAEVTAESPWFAPWSGQ